MERAKKRITKIKCGICLSKRDPSIRLIKIKETYLREKQYCKAGPTFNLISHLNINNLSEISKSMSNVFLYILLSLPFVNVSSLGLINNNTSTEEKLTYIDVVTAMVS